MNQIEVDLLDLQLCKRLSQRCFGVLVLIVPDLGHDVEVLSADHAFADAHLDSLAYELLVLVEACRI